jgi:SAM-dependent methyltransferase
MSTPAEAAALRQALCAPGGSDVREGVVDDLCRHHDMDPATAVRAALDWEAWSVEEWRAADRSTTEGITDFYRSVGSWGFDLLWYAYLQAEGLAPPTATLALRRCGPPSPGAAHLDFGSGVGVTSQLFARAGYATTLADISATLLDFSRFRLERRGVAATYLDLTVDELPAQSYDVVTAIDTLAHVPDIAATAASLHASLRPGGLLVANLDVRPPSAENSWHLYGDDLPLRASLHAAGFAPAGRAGHLPVYRRVERTPAGARRRQLVDRVVLTSRARSSLRSLRRRAGAALAQRSADR